MNYPESLRTSCPGIENHPLGPRTYVHIGGPTPLLLEPRNREELAAVVRILSAEKLPFRMLGGGSNLLINDEGVEEAVISTRTLTRFYKIEEEKDLYVLEAGLSLPRFVSTCHKQGLQGAEPLVGIPGTVGGAAVMNAGGRHGAIGSLIRRATLLTGSGELQVREVSPEAFAYRSSPLKGEVIVDVVVQLEKGETGTIWDKMSAILKEKKEAQPLMKRSCGCVFKNPAQRSAGRLLDSVGMKGRRKGDAQVSDRHANFILNQGKATFHDYFDLILDGRQRVKRNHGIDLELEVEIWGAEKHKNI